MYLDNLPVHFETNNVFGVEPFTFLSVKIKNDWNIAFGIFNPYYLDHPVHKYIGIHYTLTNMTISDLWTPQFLPIDQTSN